MSKVLEEKLEKMSEQDQKMWALRHTAEHVLHTSLQNLYPSMKKAMGPATNDGYYHDFDLDVKVTEADFPKIEKEMQRIIDLDLPLVQEFIDEKTARDIFKNNPYKLEWVDQIAKRGEKFSIFKIGEIDLDLCSGPHVKSTGVVKAFKLLSVAGAYWHGDEKNKMLTRVYGTAFYTKEELDKYLWQIEEAEKRDHRKIGKELDLFTFSDLVGSGFPLYTQRGALIRRLLTSYVEELQTKEGYQQVWTPQVAKGELFKKSGHYDKYKDDMFNVVSHYSSEEFFLKPMNCPQHTQIYAAKQHSYRDLPLRFTDFAMLYRDEKPGELNGLARVRSFYQDDCHIFCREDQVDEEVDRALKMVKTVMGTFGFKYRYRLSTRDPGHPEKYLGHPETWNKVEKWALEIMKRNNIPYYDGPGEAAFYAPKMDLMATDALGREWQLSTVQIDYVMPERFDLTYAGNDGQVKRPVMIHRAILGSPERFMMILLEHFAGALPAWLSPVQVAVLPIADRHNEYAKMVNDQLLVKGVRSELDQRADTLGAKIRDWQLQKVPYMIVLGDKELEAKNITIRKRDGKQVNGLALDEFLKTIAKEIDDKVPS